MGFKCIGDDGKFYIAAVLLNVTVENLKKNNKIAIAACSTAAESYQVKGTAEFVTEGPVYDSFVKLAEDTFKGALHTKCAIAVTPEKLIVASPNADNSKFLEI